MWFPDPKARATSAAVPVETAIIIDWITNKILCPVPTAATASVPSTPTALIETTPAAANKIFAKIEGHANPHIDRVSGLETLSILLVNSSELLEWLT